MRWDFFVDEWAIGKSKLPISKIAFYGYLKPYAVTGPELETKTMWLDTGVVGIHLQPGLTPSIITEVKTSFFENFDKHWHWPIEFFDESALPNLPGECYVAFQDGRIDRKHKTIEALFDNLERLRLLKWADEYFFSNWNNIPRLRWHEPIVVFISANLEKGELVRCENLLSELCDANITVQSVPKEIWPEGGRVLLVKGLDDA